jgi:hypothetical protein
MTPGEEHGLKSLFLRAFLSCMKIDWSELAFDGVTVEREQGRIDLLVKGGDWVLVIENKIRHAQNNPWLEYEERARRYGSRHVWFAVLSPDGSSSAPPNWKAVAYRDYCAALRAALAEILFDVPYSKWLVFAREFILHLETELYSPTTKMESAQIKFVEAYLCEIEQVKQLSKEYTDLVLREMEGRLNVAIPGYQFSGWDAGFALKCKDQGPYVWEFNLFTPAHPDGAGRFGFMVWRRHLTREQFAAAHKIVEGLISDREGWTWDGWKSGGRYESREDALREMARVGAALSKLWDPPADALAAGPVSAIPSVGEEASATLD